MIRENARSMGAGPIVISADSAQGLKLNPPVPRPSATVGEKSVVTFFDPKQGKITHTWDRKLEAWVP